MRSSGDGLPRSHVGGEVPTPLSSVYLAVVFLFPFFLLCAAVHDLSLCFRLLKGKEGRRRGSPLPSGLYYTLDRVNAL